MALPGKRGKAKRGYNNSGGSFFDFEDGEKFSTGRTVSAYDWDTENVTKLDILGSRRSGGKRFLDVYDHMDGTTKEVEIDD